MTVKLNSAYSKPYTLQLLLRLRTPFSGVRPLPPKPLGIEEAKQLTALTSLSTSVTMSFGLTCREFVLMRAHTASMASVRRALGFRQRCRVAGGIAEGLHWFASGFTRSGLVRPSRSGFHFVVLSSFGFFTVFSSGFPSSSRRRLGSFSGCGDAGCSKPLCLSPPHPFRRDLLPAAVKGFDVRSLSGAPRRLFLGRLVSASVLRWRSSLLARSLCSKGSVPLGFAPKPLALTAGVHGM